MPVLAYDLSGAVDEMAQAIAADRRAYACTCSVYTLMRGRSRPELRAALNGADWVTTDAMRVAWALRVLGARGREKVAACYTWPRLAEQTEQVYRRLLKGGRP
jgi:UDP-N-acetyl-D-mannosaminuronic acid transferase (WecB/TagA/CpsF family)